MTKSGWHLVRIALATTLVAGSAWAGVASRTHGAELAPIGQVSLDSDRQMTVTYFHQTTVDGRPLVISIDPDQEAYAGYVSIVGGIEPGETKLVYPYRGLAKLNVDGTLTVSIFGGRFDDVVVEPRSSTLAPGDPEYARTIQQVGGLQPGETKPIY